MPTHINDILDPADLQEQLDGQFINIQVHPSGKLRIYNYTHSAQYAPGKLLNPSVRVCRGLIVDSEGFVVSRPFAKFHNVAEHALPGEEAPNKPAPLPIGLPFEVYAKMDGCLGISYKIDGKVQIATRGSFMSPQAQWASAHWDANYSEVEIPDGQTWLFEIISPVSRIVVNYTFADLVLLAVIDNATGIDLPLPSNWPGRVVERFDFRDFEAVSKLAYTDPEGSKNSEGYVIRFSDGTRAKVKFADYLRLHRITFSISTTVVYEHLAMKHIRDQVPKKSLLVRYLGTSREVVDNLYDLADPMMSLIEDVPDEMYAWIHDLVDALEKQASETLLAHQEFYEKNLKGLDSKSAAEVVESSPAELNRRVLYHIIYGQSPLPEIWKIIRPAYAPAMAPGLADG